MYVHVGKTGGTTLDSILRSNCEWYWRSLYCWKAFHAQGEETILSKLTLKTIHARPIEREEDLQFVEHNITTFLFTVRNPIDRAISSFYFDHPDNIPSESKMTAYVREIFYKRCFPDMETLSTVLGNYSTPHIISIPHFENETRVDEYDCFQNGKDVLEGIGEVVYNGHLRKNYDFYMKQTIDIFPWNEVFVVRTEEFEHDLKTLNAALYDAHATALNYTHKSSALDHMTKQTHGSETYKVKTNLYKKGKMVICCYLSKENQIFENLVRSASNLGMLEKDVYMNNLYDDCGIDNRELTRPIVGGENLLSFNWLRWRRQSSKCQ